jgi:hypothetical protein
MRVLIILGNATAAVALSALVGQAGHEVAGIACNSLCALLVAAIRRPDAAIVEMRLDDGPTGGAVASALRFWHKVFPITLAADPGLITRKARPASVAVLPKPAPIADLLPSLEVAARLSRGQATGGPG